MRLAARVDVHRVNLRLLDVGDLMLLVHAVHGDIVGAEILVGDAHDVVLANLLQTLDLGHVMIPLLACHEGLAHGGHAGGVGFQRLLLALLEVIDDGRNDPVLELAGADVRDLVQQQLLDFRQCLALLGHTPQALRAVVVQELRRGAGGLHGLGLVQVDVDQAGGTVVQDHVHQHQGLLVRMAIGHSAEGNLHFLFAQILDGFALNALDLLFNPRTDLRHVLALPLAKMLGDGGNGLVDVDVATDEDAHVVGHVVGVEVILDIDQGRVLQVLGVADSGLLAIGVLLVQQAPHGVVGDAVTVVQALVLLFVHGFQLGVEQPEDRVDEAAGLDGGPLLQSVGRQADLVDGFFMPGVGVQIRGPHGVVELVHLVGDGVLGRQLGHAVDLGIDRSTGGGVCLVEVLLVQGCNLVQVGLLGGIVQRAHLLSALEQQVLQVVGQARGVGGVVLAAGLHGDFGVETRFLVVLGQVNLQPVVQFEDLGMQGVVGVLGIDAAIACGDAGRRVGSSVFGRC